MATDPYTYQKQGGYIFGAPAPTPSPAPAPAAPTPTPAPAQYTLNPDGKSYSEGASSAPTYYPRYSPNEQQANDYLDTFQAPKSQDQIQQEKTTAAQGQIDSLNKYYDSLMAEQNTVNQGRDRGTNAVSVLNGLAGSTDANNAANQTTQVNQRDNAKIQNERQVALQDIFSKIRSSAVEQARQSRIDAKSSAEDVLANRKARQEESYTYATTLAKSGLTTEGLKTTDPTSYTHLAQQVGGEEQLKALFTLNRPQETILDKRVEGGKYIIAYTNPLTGKVRMESIDLGLPQGSVQVADAGDYILFGMAGPNGKWDGDMKTTTKIPKGMSPDQKNDNALGWATLKQNKDIADAKLNADANTANPDAAKQRVTEALTLAQGLRKDDATGKSGAVGASLQKLAIGGMSLGLQPDRASFEAKVNTLKSNLTLDNLKLLKGAMSDKDLLFLNSVGSSLDTNMSEKEFNAELDRVIEKLKASSGTTDTSGPPAGTDGAAHGFPGYHSDGTQWVPN